MKLVFAGLAIGLAALPVHADDAANPLEDGASWEALRYDVVGDVMLENGDALFTVEAPYRAEDAATVPIVIRQKDASATIQALSLVIDENPAPIAGEFTFGPAMQPVDFEARVRVNQYSNVRAIATTEDGMFMTGRFVKASGGCSAPATKDPAAALAGMGEMRTRSFTPAEDGADRREAQIMIRHPNYSGLQRDQVTQLFIPAHFISELEVYQGDELLFSMEGGISISENPVFRFKYTDNGAQVFRVHAVDTDGNVFDQTLMKEAPA